MAVFLFTPKSNQVWEPAVDVYRTSWGWILKFDLAGVRLDDIEVRVSQYAVTVSGIRKDYMVEEGWNHYSMEITYSQFRRSIELPEDLEGALLRINYQDGILFVRVKRGDENQ